MLILGIILSVLLIVIAVCVGRIADILAEIYRDHFTFTGRLLVIILNAVTMMIGVVTILVVIGVLPSLVNLGA